jgi:hypothetical protein
MPAGRPPVFETSEELEQSIEDYFEKCVSKPLTFDKDGIPTPVMDAKGNPVMIDNPPTTAGLALHLGYASRQSLYDQKDRDERFSYIIKRAILAIENQHEKRLSLAGSPVGSIFWLKNHQWRDNFAEVPPDDAKNPLEVHFPEPPKNPDLLDPEKQDNLEIGDAPNE